MRIESRLWSSIAFLFTLFIAYVVSESNYKPDIKLTKESEIAKEYNYFDDSSNILVLRKDKLAISFDDGVSWKNVKETENERVIRYQFDPFNNNRAFAFTIDKFQYVTNDKGETWSKFEIYDPKNEKEHLTLNSIPHILFNAKNPDLAMFVIFHCPEDKKISNQCVNYHFLTTDGFKSNPKSLQTDASICTFAKSTKSYDVGKDETIYCSRNKLNSFGHIVESYIIASDDFFKTESKINHALAKSGSIIDVRVLQNFVIVVVQNDKFNTKSKVSLLVSKDGESFNEADLKVDISYGIMTFLESSSLSIFLAVMDYSNSFRKFSLSTVYASDSSGLSFSKVLDKVQGGSIQKVETIDGVWLANIADEIKDNKGKSKTLLDMLMGGGIDKNIKSRISYNDGEDWNLLKINNDDSCTVESECSLHLLNPTEKSGDGKFVTGPTPGILLSVGNKGSKLEKDIIKMNTWISRDGGISWDFALDEPCLFSFGDQGNIIVAIPYYGKNKLNSSNMYFSLDQGKSWQNVALEIPIFPLTLTTTVDGTSQRFILSGLIDSTPKDQTDYSFAETLYAIDFSKAFGGKKCDSKKDLEDIYTRLDPSNDKPICIYGHKEKFRRRKQNSQCFVNELFEDVKVYDDPCECAVIDFECAIGFSRSKENECKPDKKKLANICRDKKSKKISLPDKVLASGNKCKNPKEAAKEFVKTKQFKCSDYLDEDDKDKNKGNKHDIVSTFNEFDSELQQYTYVEQGETYSGENIILRTKANVAYASNNGGVEFVKIPVSDEIVTYYPGLVPGQVILITDSEKFYFSIDGGNTFQKKTAPAKPNAIGARIISFDKKDTEKFIWYSSENCDNPFSRDCSLVAYITEDGGENFQKLKEDVRSCDFVADVFEGVSDEIKNMIYCTVEDKSSRKLMLLSSTDYFKQSKKVFDNVVGYAITGNFLVAATIDDTEQSLKAKVTVDGQIFADADFPPDFHVDSQQAYTVLDSASKAIFIHVTTNNENGHEFGSILKSNSNGTSYSLTLDKVNRNRIGYVDYDRIEGIEGVIVSNVVANDHSKDRKKLKTQITHNDGGEWSYITPPVIDSNGKKYKCNGKSLSKCSLNLHGFTERVDYRDTFSSASAIGLMMAVGNVGEYLEDFDKCSTFISRDGGITWKEIKKGVYMWEYGDRGTILVLVNAEKTTDKLIYSLDEGDTWHEYKFAEESIDVLDLATVPSDTSRKFLIFGKSDRKMVSYSIDFTNIHKRQCQLDLDNPNDDDFEYWSPTHPSTPDNCLFGREAKYLRRAIGHNDCFIGSAPLIEGFKVTRNCSCTRKDYECDYNFFRDSDDTCKLVKGLSPSNRKKEMCKKENAFEYFEPTGYRKIPLSTCVGGKNFDTWKVHPCPGKQKEFNKHHGKEFNSGSLLAVIGIPIAVFLLATWFVYERGIRRNGGFKRFGQIRLDLDDDDFHPIENNEVDKAINKIVKGGIMIVAASIAGFKTLRKVDRMLFDKVTSLLFRRRPGHRNYVHVPEMDDEEEELFGNFRDNYEEELEEGTNNLNEDFNDDEPNDYEYEEEANDEVDSRLFNISDQSDEELESATPEDN
ncbi:unnamed protein product [Debaryomyces tyrocola]|nr:unnamed protein product [Debaryomyces tyrocola]